MRPNRRGFLAGLGATGLAGAAWADLPGAAYLAAARRRDGGFALYGLTAEGRAAFALPLPGRGHAAAAHPTQARAVFMARRPGDFALVVDCVTGAAIAELHAPLGRHFYGHAAFSADGAMLLTTENAFETGDGRIGLWAAEDGWRRMGEKPSGGVGPHEIVRLSSGGFAVANGGIRTHPAKGREKLNLATMRPNLTFLDGSGRVSDQIALDRDLSQNSIRHLALAPDGAVAFAMQWEGDPYAAPPLLGVAADGRVDLFEAPLPAQRRLAAYAGSVAAAGATIGFTAPRGGRAHLFDRKTGALAREIEEPDICGVAPAGKGFLATSGLGRSLALDRTGARALAAHDVQWDNHLIAL